MIKIQQSKTADTRSCDYANTEKHVLVESTCQHIGDVAAAINIFTSKLNEAAAKHDQDKLTLIDWFHDNFVTGFEKCDWVDNHRRINRHHLNNPNGVPEDVNLLDVLEYIADCVMAGMARSGSVYPLEMSPELLTRAFENTVEMLKQNVEVE